MLYTEDFTMQHYVGFWQIGSHILCHCYCSSGMQVHTVIFTGIVDNQLEGWVKWQIQYDLS